jgi:hypothetical protein
VSLIFENELPPEGDAVVGGSVAFEFSDAGVKGLVGDDKNKRSWWRCLPENESIARQCYKNGERSSLTI